jgi:fructose-1,6-bisphosphatase/inositol monophosphatase family enzyme
MKARRQVEAVALLVTATIAGEQRYLLYRNEKWKAFTFPISKVHPGEKQEDTASRIADDSNELGLGKSHGPARYLSSVPVSYWSRSQKQLTDYTYHVFHLPLSEEMAATRARDARERWLSWPQLTGQQYDPKIPISPTIPAMLFGLQAKEALPGRAERPAKTPETRLAKPVCDGLVKVVRRGLEVLRCQSEVGRAVIVGKSDTLAFDIETQYALSNAVQSMAHEIAQEHGVSLDLRVLGEESWIGTRVGRPPHRRIDITVDPCDGSTNYKGYLSSPAGYRDLLPRPDTGISIAAQVDPEQDLRYVAGVATDVQTGTIYSAYRLDERYVCRINDREVDATAFAPADVEKPKINLPFYSHSNVDLLVRLINALRESAQTRQIYPGRCRASIVDLIRMLAGDCDAMVDVRALDPDGGACLKPWDVCGMVPFFEGLGWEVCDENGDPIAWRDYNRPICLIVSRSSKLRHQILTAVEKVRKSL